MLGVIYVNNNSTELMHHTYTFLTTALLLLLSLPTTAQDYYSQRNNNTDQQVVTGNAVYYADYLAGRTTAMGEIYRPEEYTAAHKKYPKGTLLRVTRLDNGKSVTVRVNDRGPYDTGVIIDLSKAAAMDIGLLRDGRAPVRLEVVGRSENNPRRGQLPRSYQQADAYSSMTARSPSAQSRSQDYPSAASRSSYRPVTTNLGSSNPYRNDNATRRTPDNYNTSSYFSDRQQPRNGQRDEQFTAKNGYSENLYQQQPRSYGQDSRRQPQVSNERYIPAGETISSTRGDRENSSNNSLQLPSGTKGYAVQLASYKNTDNAQRQVKQYQDKGLSNLYIWRKGGYNKVIIAIFPTKTSAQQYLESIRRSYQTDGLVVKVN